VFIFAYNIKAKNMKTKVFLAWVILTVLIGLIEQI
jgi:hypothetical protein